MPQHCFVVTYARSKDSERLWFHEEEDVMTVEDRLGFSIHQLACSKYAAGSDFVVRCAHDSDERVDPAGVSSTQMLLVVAVTSSVDQHPKTQGSQHVCSLSQRSVRAHGARFVSPTLRNERA